MSLSIHAKAKKMRTYEAPSSQPAYALWRVKMWCETTFALSMMERWEKVLIYGFTFFITIFVLTGIVSYLPSHLRFLHDRASYYLLGDDGSSAQTVVRSVLASATGKADL